MNNSQKDSVFKNTQENKNITNTFLLQKKKKKRKQKKKQSHRKHENLKTTDHLCTVKSDSVHHS